MGLFDSKRPKSALMRDRAYKSNEPHEQAYVRKTRPKNPRYMADGGGVDSLNTYNVNGTIRVEREEGGYDTERVNRSVMANNRDEAENKVVAYYENKYGTSESEMEVDLMISEINADGGSIEENKRMAVETFLGGLTNDELYYVANEYADLDWDDDDNLGNQIQMWIESLSNEDINMMHEELLGYKRGGRVYKTGRAYKTDRARFNKSEDWEVPMNKRGGKSSRTMKAPSKSSASPSTGKSKYSYIPNSMLREAEVENKGKTTYIDGADILDGIYVKKGTKYADGGRVKKYNYVPNRMIEAIEVERNGKTTEIDGANILDGIYVKGKVKFADGGMMMDYGSDLTDESTVRGNITNGEIHCDTLTEIIGCEPNYPCHNVGSLKLTKCFLRPYYKIG